MTRKIIWIFIIAFLSLTLLNSCNDDVVSAGTSALQDGEHVLVKCDTFSVTSSVFKADPLAIAPDSFLLGECNTIHYGTLKADILAQFAYPTSFHYPDGSEVDSVCLVMYYRSWHGDGNAPLKLTAYEMDRNTLQYTTRYTSDESIDDYCSLTPNTKVFDNEPIIVASRPQDSAYSKTTSSYTPYIKIRLNKTYTDKLFAIRDVADQEAFNNLFHGLYITSNYGSSTILHVSDISMAVYYHYPVPVNDEGTEFETLNDIKFMYANSEVRQVNRFEYPNRDDIYGNLSSVSDTNYILTPANVYTRMSFPIKKIMTDILDKIEHREPYINQASLVVHVLNGESDGTNVKDSWAMPASYMLLIKEDQIESFIALHKLPNDTDHIYSPLTYALNGEGELVYYYKFDLRTMLTDKIRTMSHQSDTAALAETLDLVLMPIAIETSASSSSTSTTITAVKPVGTVTSTVISSAESSSEPLDLKMVYCGFSNVHY